MSAPADYANLVQELYVTYLGRPADPTGLQNFEAALAAANAPVTLAGLSSGYGVSATVTALLNGIGISSESTSLYGSIVNADVSTAHQFITAIYQNLFDRVPEAGGLLFWSNALLSGQLTAGNAAMEIALAAAPADATAVNNKTAAATVFTTVLLANNGATAYSGQGPAGEGRAYLHGINGSTDPSTFQAGAGTAVDNILGTTTPPTQPSQPATSTLALTVAGDSIHLNTTTAASAVSLSGADLAAFPASTFGTVAGLHTAGVTTVTNSGGNFTLDASGNSSATTFDFGTGATGGADAVSAAGIAYHGVTTYVTSLYGDTVTLSAAAQNVIASNDGNTINLGSLIYTGTLDLNSGLGGTDTIHATVGGNLGGATLMGGGNAHIALVLSGAGTETLSTGEYNLITAASGGSITFAGSLAGANTIAFSNAGTVTETSSVGNYDLSSAGNAITLTSATANVNGAASGNNIVAIPQFSYGGTLAFGAAGTDIVQAPTNGDFSGLTVTSSGATLELMITGVAAGVPSGSTTTTEVYNAFTTGPHAGGIVFPAGGDTNPADYVMGFSDQGTVTDSAHITNYDLNASVHSTINDIYTFTIANNAADNITEFSAATGGSTYNINVATFTGSLSLGSSGDDAIVVSAGSDISGGSIASAGTTASLTVGGSGTVTVSSAEAALFHDAPSGITAQGNTNLDVADSSSSINLSAQENALTTVGLQSDNNTVNVSVGAASINAGAAGFNQTLVENGSSGNNTFNIDNGNATIIGASDASHYVTINNFNTTSDNINLTLSGNGQNAGEQNISDSGNDTVTVGVNSVIIEEDLGALPGFSTFDATNLSGAAANMLRAINASTATTGAYTFVIDSNQGAAIYEIHVNSGGGTIDGIQLVGVVHGVGAFNLINHVS